LSRVTCARSKSNSGWLPTFFATRVCASVVSAWASVATAISSKRSLSAAS